MNNYAFTIQGARAVLSELISGVDVTQPATISITVPVGADIVIIDDVIASELGIHIRAERDARANYQCAIAVPAAVEKIVRSVHTYCEQPGSFIRVFIACKTEAAQQVSIATLQQHVAPDSGSELIIRGVGLGSSKVVVESLIRIEKGAQRVDASQEHKHLLFGQNARAYSDPKLEVLAHDVACAHGAAIKHIDDEALFYLQSRGLSHLEATDVLIDGFLRGKI